jgi:hypothetical protein
LQNENGPCPLIAISNVLAVRGDIKLESKNDRISVGTLVEKITEYLQSKHQDEQTKQEIEQIVKEMPDLQYGLDVNFTFTR